jgi:hypothetical protein
MSKQVSEYSVRNQQTILTARPTATLLAGYHQWLAEGRAVKRGEKGIKILAVMSYNTLDEKGKDVTKTGMGTVTVFDIEQTEEVIK